MVDVRGNFYGRHTAQHQLQWKSYKCWLEKVIIYIRSQIHQSGVYTINVSQLKSIKVTVSNFDQSDFDSVNGRFKEVGSQIKGADRRARLASLCRWHVKECLNRDEDARNYG